MDLEVIAPIIKETIQQVLSEETYPFGFAKYTGLSDKVASATLKNSVQVTVVNSDTKSVVEIFMEDYWINVQNGRRPFPNRVFRRTKGQESSNRKSPFLEALEKWIKDRGLTGRDKKGKFISRKRFAFAIRQNINKFGIRPSNFLDDVFLRLETDQRIIDALGDEAFEDLLNKIEGI